MDARALLCALVVMLRCVLVPNLTVGSRCEWEATGSAWSRDEAASRDAPSGQRRSTLCRQSDRRYRGCETKETPHQPVRLLLLSPCRLYGLPSAPSPAQKSSLRKMSREMTFGCTTLSPRTRVPRYLPWIPRWTSFCPCSKII